MKKILITGACGFIGRAVMQSLLAKYKVIVFNRKIPNTKNKKIIFVKGNITDSHKVKQLCDVHAPDVVVHCIGLSHQNHMSSMDQKLYDVINHIATCNLAESAARANPNVHFIFLSSISVYGKNYKYKGVAEKDPCEPASAYAKSKLDAEQGLETIFSANRIKRIDILRLAPVYDAKSSFNLDKRVFGPRKLFYLRYGSGKQKMSLLSRQNLVDFILFRIQNNSNRKYCNIFNITDKIPCSFNTIIQIFIMSEYQPVRRIIKVPLWLVWVATRMFGLLVRNEMELVHSFYDKLAKDLIFDNKKMLGAGFNPKHTVKSVYCK